MRASGYIAWTFWAVIVLTAIELAPAVALAHAGHAHDRATVSGRPTTATEADKAAVAQSGVRRDAELSNADRATASTPDAAGACIGGCCGNGMACCGVALSTEPFGNLLPPSRSLRTTPLNAPDASGTDPQALRKPPRSFA
jgi:hypothetical protein